MQVSDVSSRAMAVGPVTLLGAQLLGLLPLLLAVWLTYRLPSAVDARYCVYQDVESARARILLPVRGAAFPQLQSDSQASAAFDIEASIPFCGGNQHAEIDYVPTQLPEWVLPADESGLIGFADAIVRTICSHRAASQWKVAIVATVAACFGSQ